MYLNLVLNSFSLRILRISYQLRSFESIAKTDNYDLLSGNQWKKIWDLADTATEFPVWDTKRAYLFWSVPHATDIRELLTEEDLEGSRCGFIK